MHDYGIFAYIYQYPSEIKQHVFSNRSGQPKNLFEERATDTIILSFRR